MAAPNRSRLPQRGQAKAATLNKKTGRRRSLRRENIIQPCPLFGSDRFTRSSSRFKASRNRQTSSYWR
jgi:hypothetical protein